MMPVVVLLFLAPLLFKAEANPLSSNPAECSDVYSQNQGGPSGVYTIYPSGYRFGIPVYCDMGSEGGWTVFQRRMDGSVNFYRGWEQYVAGFGAAEGEYWLGLEVIHKITDTGPHELLVDMEDFDGNKASAHYTSFSVGGDSDGYRLTVSGFNNCGEAGDSLSFHNAMKFSTFDRDQDTWEDNCAKKDLGAWWFKNCHKSNPNSVYLWGAAAEGTNGLPGVIWYTLKGNKYSLKTISFKMRPVQ